MKVCYKCKKSKVLENFYKDSSKKDGYGNTCKECHKQYYKSNKNTLKLINFPEKPKVTSKRPKNYNILRAIRAWKELFSCADCGKRYPHYVMDWDHVRGVKSFKPTQIGYDIRDINKINLEVLKCELVCSNCHRVRTWNRSHA